MSTQEPSARSRKGLGKAIALSDRDVEDARRLLELLSSSRREPAIARTPPTDSKLLAASLLRLRASRLKFFPQAMFGEPAWDLMLAIHASTEGDRLTVTSLAESLRLPLSSTARWARYLETQGLAQRQPDPKDCRSQLIELTEKGQAQLRSYIVSEMSD